MSDPTHSTDNPAKFMSSVKVGPKGQIVIPREVRAMFGIEPGDLLLLLADSSRGIAIQRMEHFDRIADEIFLKAEVNPDNSEQAASELKFAEAVKKAGATGEIE